MYAFVVGCESLKCKIRPRRFRPSSAISHHLYVVRTSSRPNISRKVWTGASKVTHSTRLVVTNHSYYELITLKYIPEEGALDYTLNEMALELAAGPVRKILPRTSAISIQHQISGGRRSRRSEVCADAPRWFRWRTSSRNPICGPPVVSGTACQSTATDQGHGTWLTRAPHSSTLS